MLKNLEFERVLRQFNERSTAAKEARVSVELPDKSLWDIGEIFLAANAIVGNRETHRIVIRINKETASPGKILWKL